MLTIVVIMLIIMLALIIFIASIIINMGCGYLHMAQSSWNMVAIITMETSETEYESDLELLEIDSQL